MSGPWRSTPRLTLGTTLPTASPNTAGRSAGVALGTKECGSINVEFYTDVEQRLDEPVILSPALDAPSLAGKRVLVVDDVSDSGRTLRLVVDIIRNAGADVRSACLYSTW